MKPNGFRRFHISRDVDLGDGIGKGAVGEGVQFSIGRVVVIWYQKTNNWTRYKTFESFLREQDAQIPHPKWGVHWIDRPDGDPGNRDSPTIPVSAVRGMAMIERIVKRYKALDDHQVDQLKKMVVREGIERHQEKKKDEIREIVDSSNK